MGDFRSNGDKLRDLENALRSYPQHLPRVQTARQNLEREKGEMEAQSHDRELLGEVRGMEQIKALGDLRTARARLETLNPRAENTRTVLAAAREGLDERIKGLEEWANGLKETIAHSASKEELQSVRDQILARSMLFDETPEAEILKEAAQSAALLSSALTAIEDLERDAANALHLGPAAVEGWENRLGDYESQAAGAALPDAARNRLATLRREMAQGVQSAQQTAARWLAAHREAMQNGCEPHTLRRELARPQLWLSTEGQSELEVLRAEVEARLESDEVGRIVERFRAISDPTRRAACLEQLRALQAELESAVS